MTLAQFFESEIVRLPKSGPSDDLSFDCFLADIFGQYISLVSQLDDSKYPTVCELIKGKVEQIKYISDEIVKTLKFYLDGHPHLAYSTFFELLDHLKIETLFTTLAQYKMPDPLRSWVDDLLESALHPPLYRVRSDRTAASDGALSRKDMFHVPFEKRRLVANQRYSIAGLPSLYLGSSIWICWEEMGRPSLNSLLVSRFRIAEPTVVLDLQFTPELAWRVFNLVQEGLPEQISESKKQTVRDRYGDKYVFSYAVFWPLIAACSMRVHDRTGSFHPEYVIPQLLLRWVTATEKHKVDGIRYFSTRTRNKQFDVFAHTNCVFPSRNIKPKGRCSHLRRKFHLTTPITWELLTAMKNSERFIFGPSNVGSAVQANSDLVINYSATDFFAAEVELWHLEENRDQSKEVED